MTVFPPGPGGPPAHRSPPASPRPPAPGTAEHAVDDAVEAAAAVVAAAVTIVRYAVDTTAREARAVLPRVPLVGRGRPVLRRVLTGTPARVLAHPGAAVARALSAVADDLVPGVARAVLARLDVPALVREFVDVNQLAGQLDVDAVAARIDLDAIVARIDIEGIAAGLDLNALVEKVDVTRVIDRVDLDAVVGRVDLDRAVDRVDVERVLDRVDLDAVVRRVDLDRAVERVDVDRVIARVDVGGLARYVIAEIDLPALLRSSTGSVTTEMVRGVRVQGADADRSVERVVDRLLRRNGRRTATSGDAEAPGTADDDG